MTNLKIEKELDFDYLYSCLPDNLKPGAMQLSKAKIKEFCKDSLFQFWNDFDPIAKENNPDWCKYAWEEFTPILHSETESEFHNSIARFEYEGYLLNRPEESMLEYTEEFKNACECTQHVAKLFYSK